MSSSSNTNVPPRLTACRWFWAALLGAALAGGGVLALIIASTTVVLPYDETFCGLTRDQLLAVNGRLLAFLAHDRVSLSGAMIACGVMYIGLAVGGMRTGMRWAEFTFFTSAFAGFSTFFLFLGFGYFDPFHAFASAALLQLLLMALLADPNEATPTLQDVKTRMPLGQWVMLAHAAALIAGGLVFCILGTTRVFVATDLEFMNTSTWALRQASPRLMPLVAHDRATLGGMLLANGLAFLLSARWGLTPGSRWLWWTWLIAGVSAYGATLGVHWAVGYTDFEHLSPAYAGTVLLAIGLTLTRRAMRPIV